MENFQKLIEERDKCQQSLYDWLETYNTYETSVRMSLIARAEIKKTRLKLKEYEERIERAKKEAKWEADASGGAWRSNESL